MDLHEQYARLICTTRGGDPDAPLSVVQADGTSVQFEFGWQGYADLAAALLALHAAA